MDFIGFCFFSILLAVLSTVLFISALDDFERHWGIVFICLGLFMISTWLVYRCYETGYRNGAIEVLENKVEWKKGEQGWEKIGLKPQIDTVYIIVPDTCKHN